MSFWRENSKRSSDWILYSCATLSALRLIQRLRFGLKKLHNYRGSKLGNLWVNYFASLNFVFPMDQFYFFLRFPSTKLVHTLCYIFFFISMHMTSILNFKHTYTLPFHEMHISCHKYWSKHEARSFILSWSRFTTSVNE